MRTEIYSVRSSTDEIEYIRTHFKELTHALDEITSTHVLFKTEIDSNPRKIKKEFINSICSDNPPEFYIYANALDTEDSSSFRRLFSPLIKVLEKELVNEVLLSTNKSAGQELDLVVSTISVEGESYPAYAFSFQKKKVLVLPRIKFINSSYKDYIINAITKAKEIFKEQAENHSRGYIISSPEEAVSKKTPLSDADDSLALPEADSKPESDSKETKEDAAPDEAKEISKEKADKTEEITPKKAVDSTSEEASENPPEEKKKKGAKAFLMSFIPHKGDSVKNIILKIVVLVAVAAFLVSAGLLLNFFVIQPYINTSNMKEIQNIYYASYDEVSTIIDDDGNTVAVSGKTKNWDGLKKINKEIVGWIKIDKTVIDYPVLEHKGDDSKNQYYLYRNYKGEYSDFGSIFLDYRCTQGVNSKNVILHGHNMGSDKSMFATLTKYPGNLDYYKSAPIIHFDTPEANGDYAIFSVMKINVSNENKAIFNYLLGEFDSSAQFMNFIYNIKELSYLNVNLPINENDRLLTLSTCSYEAQNMRTVVVARKIREGEDISKYVNSAKTKSPAYSITSTFSKELEAGAVKWYDGEGKLEGNEELRYLEQADMYVVKYLDGNGKAISTQYVLKGEDAKVPKTIPRKAASNGYYYEFKKWSSNGKNIQKNTTITPVFTERKLKPVASTPFPTVEIEDDWEETMAPVAPDPVETTAATAAATTNP